MRTGRRWGDPPIREHSELAPWSLGDRKQGEGHWASRNLSLASVDAEKEGKSVTLGDKVEP